VKEGELAPFQELVYLTAPTVEEDTWIVAERKRFADLQLELLTLRTGSVPFADWLRARLHERRRDGAPDGQHPGGRLEGSVRAAPGPEPSGGLHPARAGDDGGLRLTWSELEREQPALARAGLRLAHDGVVELPPGARLREEHQVTADAQDWAVLLEAYAREHLLASQEREDARLLTAVREVLPSLGYLLTVRGLRSTTSPVDRICALSAAKAGAAVHVLEAESDALGGDLRALVLCDYEQRTASAPASLAEAGEDRPAGSARLAFLALARSDLGDRLRPVLVTGRTVALRRADFPDFKAFTPTALTDRLLAEPLDGDRSLVTLSAGIGWGPRVWLPLVTRWLEAGGTQALVGTRSLLGEGWDCPPLNVVVDLTAAATPAAVTQLRGRSLRLDPDRPDKVADNWTVACVAEDHPRGDADYLRAVRKHEHHLAPAADGVVETGIGHCDPELRPYAPPDRDGRDAVNARALARAAERDAARTAWAVGEDYRGAELTTLRVRTERPLGLPGGTVPAALLTPSQTLGATAPAVVPDDRSPAQLWPLPVGSAVAVGAFGALAASPGTGLGLGLGTGVLATAVVGGQRYLAQTTALRDTEGQEQTATLTQLAHAVADALQAGGATTVGAAGVRIAGTSGGAVSCELDAPAPESALFAASLDELLAPLADPRWLVSRLVLPAPTTAVERRRLALARTLGRPVEAAVAWHAVPAALSRSRARVSAFEAAWRTHVGAGRLVLGKDPEGAALLELLRGEDPFALTSRVRTVWR